jgi:DNA-directed RNA polymerase subunit N (RpoN/RPB10)
MQHTFDLQRINKQKIDQTMNGKEFLDQLGLKLKCQRIMAELSIKEVQIKHGFTLALFNLLKKALRIFIS